MKKVIAHYQKPIKFMLVGGSGALLQLALLYLFTDIIGVWYIASSIMAIGVAMVWNYLLNNYWTFKAKTLL